MSGIDFQPALSKAIAREYAKRENTPTANPFRSLSKEELLKLNLLWLVQDHRAKCDKSCNVSLCLVREIAERAGIKFTAEEQALFA